MTLSPPSKTQSRNHGVWLGPLVVFCGAVSYFTVFVSVPALRDFPWLNLPLVWVGLLVSVLGVRVARRRGRGRLLAWSGLLSSLLLAAAFHGYVFWYSYQLPDHERALEVGSPAPEFTLLDQERRPLTLSELRGRYVVLVFYRGYW
jgi:hypothetical protein